jgi:prepilin-type N-terminal cleavage/methylation domain-containing protein
MNKQDVIEGAMIKDEKGQIKTNMKKGFSLIEMGIVLVLLGIIYGVFFHESGGKIEETAMEASIDSTAKSLTNAVQKHGRKTSTGAKFTNVGAIALLKEMPKGTQANDTGTALVVDDNTAEFIKGTTELEEVCEYYAASDKQSATGTNGYGVQIIQDCSKGATDRGWDQIALNKAEERFALKMSSYSTTTVQVDYNATAIANTTGNVAFTAGGTASDGIVGIRYFSK